MSMDSSYFDDEANASAFTKYHVRLPDEVYRYMASLCEPNNELSGDGPKVHSPNRKLAIDLACGSGHSTVPIAKYFQEVIGVDICRSQIECAPKDVPNIRYKVGPAECLEFVEDDSVDLVLTVAALHWLEVPRVYDEVKRVLRKGGVFCACDYRALSSSYDITEASALWHQFVRDDIKEYYPKGWKHFHRFTFAEFQMDHKHTNKHFVMVQEWSFEEIMGFVRCILAWLPKIPGHENDVDEFLERLLTIYRKHHPDVPDKEIRVKITFSILVISGYK